MMRERLEKSSNDLKTVSMRSGRMTGRLMSMDGSLEQKTDLQLGGISKAQVSIFCWAKYFHLLYRFLVFDFWPPWPVRWI